MKKMKRLVVAAVLVWLCASTSGGAHIMLGGLPAPSHGNFQYVGYHFADSKHGDYSSHVYPYTNLFIALVQNAADTQESDWQTPLAAQMARAVSAGKRILLVMSDSRDNVQNLEFSWDAVLDVADEFWSSIDMVQVVDENETNGISAEDLADEISLLRSKFAAHSLPDRHVQAEFKPVEGGCLPAAISAEGLDSVAFQAFLPDDDSFEDEEDAIEFLEDFLNTCIGQASMAGKQVLIEVQAFTRGNWEDIDLLGRLQETYYEVAANESNVIGLGFFAYVRLDGTGTLHHPDLAYHHKRIAWAAGLSDLRPGCTPGYGNCLAPEQWRAENGYIQSRSGQYRMYYQWDGNLVVYDLWNSWAVVWASYSFHASGYVQMQGDGNLVIYNASSQAAWWTGTGVPGSWLYLSDDGHLAVVKPNLDVIWIRGPIHNY